MFLAAAALFVLFVVAYFAVEVDAISATAREKITAAGGTVR